MYVGLKQPRGDGERYVTPARAAAKETSDTIMWLYTSCKPHKNRSKKLEERKKIEFTLSDFKTVRGLNSSVAVTLYKNSNFLCPGRKSPF